jgi:hypothetical protein
VKNEPGPIRGYMMAIKAVVAQFVALMAVFAFILILLALREVLF